MKLNTYLKGTNKFFLFSSKHSLLKPFNLRVLVIFAVSYWHKKSVEHFVYLLEALESPYQINNTPHRVWICPKGTKAIQGDECIAHP